APLASRRRGAGADGCAGHPAPPARRGSAARTFAGRGPPVHRLGRRVPRPPRPLHRPSAHRVVAAVSGGATLSRLEVWGALPCPYLVSAAVSICAGFGASGSRTSGQLGPAL